MRWLIICSVVFCFSSAFNLFYGKLVGRNNETIARGFIKLSNSNEIIQASSDGSFKVPLVGNNYSDANAVSSAYSLYLNAWSIGFRFNTLRLDFSLLNDDGNLKVYSFDGSGGVEFEDELTPIESFDSQLQWIASKSADYFSPRERFSILSVVMNPMFLMMGFSMVLMLIMPKLMEQAQQEQ